MKLPFELRAFGVAIAIAIGWSPAASAITLKEAFEAAQRNDPTFQVNAHEYEAGREAVAIGRSQLMPRVDASYSANKNRADLRSPPYPVMHPEYISRSKAVQLRQPLFDLDALARYREGQAQTKQAEAAFDSAKADLAARVVGAYLDALFAQEQVKLAQAQAKMYQEQRNVNERLFAKGEGTKTDMLETQARLDVSNAQLLEAQDNLTVARNTLQGIIGVDPGTLSMLKTSFAPARVNPATFEEWYATALANNPELRASRFAVDAATQEVNRNLAGHFPRVDLTAAYSQNDAETLNTYTQHSTNRAIGIQVSIPLFAGGYVSATTRQAVANRERARADVDVRTNRIEVDLRKSYSLCVSSVAKVQALEKAVASSTELVKATEQSIKGGVRINLDLLNAQQQLMQNQRDLAQARYSYLNALMHLRAAAGKLTPGDVYEVAALFE